MKLTSILILIHLNVILDVGWCSTFEEEMSSDLLTGRRVVALPLSHPPSTPIIIPVFLCNILFFLFFSFTFKFCNYQE